MASSARVSLLGRRVRRAELLDAELCEPLSHVDGGVEGFALHDAGDETAGERVTSECQFGVLGLSE